MKNFIAIFLSIAIIVTLPFLSMASDEEHNLVTSATTLIGDIGSFQNNVLKLPNNGNEYLTSLSLRNLTNDYSMTGDVKIRQVGPNPWNGVRFCVGNRGVTNWTLVYVTKEMGVMVNNRDPSEGWLDSGIPTVSAANSITLSDGTVFNFRVVKKALHIIFYINDKLIFDNYLAEGTDLFTDGAVDNVGFFNSQCAIEINNLKVIDLNVIVSPPPSIVFTSSKEDQDSGAASSNSYYLLDDNNVYAGYINPSYSSSSKISTITPSTIVSSSTSIIESISNASSSNMSSSSIVSSKSSSSSKSISTNSNNTDKTAGNGFLLIIIIAAGLVIVATFVFVLIQRSKKNK